MCRVHIEADRSLKIERVRLSDAGMYLCHAENSVSFVEASAKLIVHCMASRSLLVYYIKLLKNMTFPSDIVT